mmetsp:Transcript_56336/g.180884  ORF Transcript_56336/g.180884 Transcript_56336/m.180884 type:complete len:336 (+) Transcript_56336:730-1737(+)
MPPSQHLLADVREHRPQALRLVARQERGKRVHGLLLDELPEAHVAAVLSDALVDVGARGEEDEVAGRDPGSEVAVQRFEKGQAAGVDHVLWEVLVASSGEDAAARQERVVHVAQDLDAPAAPVQLLADLQRLLREVGQDLLAHLVGGDVGVDQLEEVVVGAPGVEQGLELRELLAWGAQDEAPDGVLVKGIVREAALLQRVHQDGLGPCAEQAPLNGFVAEQVLRARLDDLHEAPDIDVLQDILQRRSIAVPDDVPEVDVELYHQGVRLQQSCHGSHALHEQEQPTSEPLEKGQAGNERLAQRGQRGADVAENDEQEDAQVRHAPPVDGELEEPP